VAGLPWVPKVVACPGQYNGDWDRESSGGGGGDWLSLVDLQNGP